MVKRMGILSALLLGTLRWAPAARPPAAKERERDDPGTVVATHPNSSQDVDGRASHPDPFDPWVVIGV